MSGAQLFARIDAAALSAQPLAVEEVGSRTVLEKMAAGEAFDGFPVVLLRSLAFAQNCP